MDRKIKRFLPVYITAVMAVSLLTLNRISFLTLPSPSMLGLNLLPLTGTYILLPGVIIGAAIILIAGDKTLAKRFLMLGIVFDILFSAAVCNLFRPEILSSVAARYGKASAMKTAESGRYTSPAFNISKNLPRLQRFIRTSHDKKILREHYTMSYNRTFEELFPIMIDREKLFEQGYRNGYIEGLMAGRRANIREEPFLEEPLGGQPLQRVITQHLPDFVEGYTQGYKKGWNAGYGEDIRSK